MTAEMNREDGHGRGPWFRPEELDDAQRAVYDSITTGPRAAPGRKNPLVDEQGRLQGPFNALLNSPTVGDAVQRLGAAIRYESGLEDRSRELATLEVALAKRSDFEWNAHVQAGYAMGLTEAEVAAVRTGGECESLSAYERTVREVVRELLATEDLSDATYARACAAIGQVALMEVIVLVGYYNLLATSMRVWQVPLAEGMSAVFAD